MTDERGCGNAHPRTCSLLSIGAASPDIYQDSLNRLETCGSVQLEDAAVADRPEKYRATGRGTPR